MKNQEIEDAIIDLTEKHELDSMLYIAVMQDGLTQLGGTEVSREEAVHRLFSSAIAIILTADGELWCSPPSMASCSLPYMH